MSESPVHQPTPECSGAEVADGMAMAIHPEATPPYLGMLAVARGPCPFDTSHPNQPLLTLVRFKKTGALLDNGQADPAAYSLFGGIGDAPKDIASHHGLARIPGSNQFNLTYTQGGMGRSWSLLNPTILDSRPFPFADQTGISNSITSSSNDFVLEAAVVSNGNTGSNVMLRASPTTGMATTTTRAAAVAIAASTVGSRGVLATRSASGVTSWAIVDAAGSDLASGLLSNNPAQKNGFDVTALGDNVIVALGGTSSIDLVRLANVSASTENASSRTISLTANDTAALTTFDGNHLAIAGLGDRVIVAWLSRRQLTANVRIGGYAIFACH